MLKPRFIIMFMILTGFISIFIGCERPIKKYHEGIYTMNLYSEFEYNLSDPDTVFYLPSFLNEISGLGLIDDSRIAVIQDERGKMYIVNLITGLIDHEVLFGKNADYEGIELVGNSVFVSKSNGDIYKFTYDPGKDEVESEVIKTPLKSRNDVEGLAFDKMNNRLLIACKGKGDVNDNGAKGKSIYAMDLTTSNFNVNPLYGFKKKDISAIIQTKYPDMKLSDNVDPSGIAVHPISGKIYILAHSGKALVILNTEGAIEEFYPLNPSLFQQPEGICFNSNGDMFISNEVGMDRPNLLKFSYQNEN